VGRTQKKFGPPQTSELDPLTGVFLSLISLRRTIEVVAMSFFQVTQAEQGMWLSFLAVMLPRDIALTLSAYRFTALYGAFGLGLAYVIAWLLYSAVIFPAIF
jgi:hypothetical protein